MAIRSIILSAFLVLSILLFPLIGIAQSSDSAASASFVERNLGGPRIGLMYVSDNGDLAKAFQDRNLGRWMSQFGWLFEYQVIPEGGAPSFLVQFSSLVTGVEQGVFYPNFTLLLGIRTIDGIEFGLGPNIMIGSGDISHSALTVSAGKIFTYGGVNIPLNLAISTSPHGTRLSFQFGYAITKSK